MCFIVYYSTIQGVSIILISLHVDSFVVTLFNLLCERVYCVACLGIGT